MPTDRLVQVLLDHQAGIRRDPDLPGVAAGDGQRAFDRIARAVQLIAHLEVKIQGGADQRVGQRLGDPHRDRLAVNDGDHIGRFIPRAFGGQMNARGRGRQADLVLGDRNREAGRQRQVIGAQHGLAQRVIADIQHIVRLGFRTEADTGIVGHVVRGIDGALREHGGIPPLQREFRVHVGIGGGPVATHYDDAHREGFQRVGEGDGFVIGHFKLEYVVMLRIPVLSAAFRRCGGDVIVVFGLRDGQDRAGGDALQHALVAAAQLEAAQGNRIVVLQPVGRREGKAAVGDGFGQQRLVDRHRLRLVGVGKSGRTANLRVAPGQPGLARLCQRAGQLQRRRIVLRLKLLDGEGIAVRIKQSAIRLLRIPGLLKAAARVHCPAVPILLIDRDGESQVSLLAWAAVVFVIAAQVLLRFDQGIFAALQREFSVDGNRAGSAIMRVIEHAGHIHLEGECLVLAAGRLDGFIYIDLAGFLLALPDGIEGLDLFISEEGGQVFACKHVVRPIQRFSRVPLQRPALQLEAKIGVGIGHGH